jgi:periplasmic divalent cation tolerance protein
MKDFIIVLNTVPDERTGYEIGRRLVEERLAACVTVSGAAKSLYWWEGKIAEEREFVLLIKTKASLFGRLEERLKELHPYRVPEIIALPVVKGAANYLAWLDEETGG